MLGWLQWAITNKERKINTCELRKVTIAQILMSIRGVLFKNMIDQPTAVSGTNIYVANGTAFRSGSGRHKLERLREEQGKLQNFR